MEINKRISKPNGITLVALIITIIVMLILVGVSIQVVINSNLIGTAQDAADRTETQYLEESKAGSLIEIEGKKYLSIEDYEAGIERAPDIMEGEGTEANPYTIDSIEALVQFAHSVTNGKTYEGEYVKLTRNLDFKSADSYLNANRTDYAEYGYTGNLMTALTTGEGWQPIGNSADNGLSGKHFIGTFDGNGKIISNLIINKNNNIVRDMGLFSGNVGTIKNLGMANCDIDIVATGEQATSVHCGTICGYNYGEIDSCWSSGSIDITLNEVNNPLRTGGIIGCSSAVQKDSITIKNCYNKVTINVEREGAGGSLLAIGGIVGASTKTLVSSCYNVGNIRGVYSNGASNTVVGGVVGYGCKKGTSLYNLGDVFGSTTQETIVGGVVAQGESIEKCYNTGLVEYEASSTKRIGAVIGVITETQTNSYYLNNTELNGIGRNYSGATEPTKVNAIEEMPTVLSVVGSAFKADTNNINGGYPILNWQ